MRNPFINKLDYQFLDQENEICKECSTSKYLDKWTMQQRINSKYGSEQIDIIKKQSQNLTASSNNINIAGSQDKHSQQLFTEGNDQPALNLEILNTTLNFDKQQLQQSQKKMQQAIAQNEKNKSQNISDIIQKSIHLQNDNNSINESSQQDSNSNNQDSSQLISQSGQQSKSKINSYLLELNQQRQKNFIQREINKKLLNDIVLRKIKQSALIQEKSNYQKQEDIIQLQVRQDTEVKEIIKDKSEVISEKTCSHFKILNQSLKKPVQFINFEDLFQQLDLFINQPQQIFEFKVKIQNSQKDAQNLKEMELIFKDALQKTTLKLQETQQKIQENRQSLSEFSEKLKQVNEEYQKSVDEIYQQIKNQENQIIQILRNNNNKLKKPTIQKDNRKPTIIKAAIQNNKDIKMLEEKMSTLKEVLKKDREFIMSQIKNDSENCNVFEIEQKKLKELKQRIKQELTEIYLSLLKSDQSLQKQSLSWIIKALLNIKQDITQIDIFPYYLDKFSIDYLIESSKMEIQVEDLKIKLMQLQTQLIKQQEQNETHQNEQKQTQQKNKYNKSQSFYNDDSLKNLNNLIEDLKSKFSSPESPQFIYKGLGARGIAFQKMINSTNFALISQQQKSDITSLQLEFQSIKKQIEKIQIDIAQQKIKEEQRIFEKFFKAINNEEKINQIRLALKALFGESEGANIFFKFKFEQKQITERIKANKTFNFSSLSGFVQQNAVNEHIQNEDMIKENEKQEEQSQQNYKNQDVLNKSQMGKKKIIDKQLFKKITEMRQLLMPTKFEYNNQHKLQVINQTQQLDNISGNNILHTSLMSIFIQSPDSKKQLNQSNNTQQNQSSRYSTTGRMTPLMKSRVLSTSNLNGQSNKNKIFINPNYNKNTNLANEEFQTSRNKSSFPNLQTSSHLSPHNFQQLQQKINQFNIECSQKQQQYLQL